MNILWSLNWASGEIILHNEILWVIFWFLGLHHTSICLIIIHRYNAIIVLVFFLEMKEFFCISVTSNSATDIET